MAKFLKLHIGGVLKRNVGGIGSASVYEGGNVNEKIDVDEINFHELLHLGAKNGFKNLTMLYFCDPSKGCNLSNSLRLVYDDRCLSPIFKLFETQDIVDIYYEHGSKELPYFNVDNPKTVCDNFGIDEHGRRLGPIHGNLPRDRLVEDNVAIDGRLGPVDDNLTRDRANGADGDSKEVKRAKSTESEPKKKDSK